MKLYVYNHCPYCTKTRLVADLSGLIYDLVFLANDDEKSHFDKINSKQVPFLEKDDGTFLKESISICKYIVEIQNFNIINSYKSKKIKIILDTAPDYKKIVYPRVPNHPNNRLDFPTQSAKNYFINKKSKYIGDMRVLLTNPPSNIIDLTNKFLKEIEEHINIPFFDGDRISWDDIEVFSILFILTIAKDLICFPENILDYIRSIEKKTNIELY